jgi:hypothetical protein
MNSIQEEPQQKGSGMKNMANILGTTAPEPENHPVFAFVRLNQTGHAPPQQAAWQRHFVLKCSMSAMTFLIALFTKFCALLRVLHNDRSLCRKNTHSRTNVSLKECPALPAGTPVNLTPEDWRVGIAMSVDGTIQGTSAGSEALSPTVVAPAQAVRTSTWLLPPKYMLSGKNLHCQNAIDRPSNQVLLFSMKKILSSNADR